MIFYKYYPACGLVDRLISDPGDGMLFSSSAMMKKKYLVGTSGFNYDHWKEKFYPAGLKKKERFGYYAEHFNTVEINYSFYRWPEEKTVRKWYDQAPQGFMYSMKAPRFMTHMKKLNNIGDDLERFYGLGEILDEKMGCYLFQLPPNLHYKKDNMVKLEHFTGALDGRKKNVIEFRHESWWNDDVFSLLKEKKTAFCNVNGLGMPEDVVATARFGYFRFHGNDYDSRYSTGELEEYAHVMKEIGDTNLFAYFNNDKHAYAVDNAEQLKKILNS